MYATDGETDGQTKATLIAPCLRAGASQRTVRLFQALRRRAVLQRRAVAWCFTDVKF